jgi:hypothetical protein
LIDWTTILANAGIPEPPGRLEAYEAIKMANAERLADCGFKQSKGKRLAKLKS